MKRKVRKQTVHQRKCERRLIETVVAGIIRSFCLDCHHLPTMSARGVHRSDIPCGSSRVTHCVFHLQASFVVVELVSSTEITFELLLTLK
jgi:hypothetical protein